MAENLAENALVPLPPAPPGHMRAASFLHANHGQDAIAEAVRHGMLARQRGDEAAMAFWCGVCSLLVQMRQSGSADPDPSLTNQWSRPQKAAP